MAGGKKARNTKKKRLQEAEVSSSRNQALDRLHAALVETRRNAELENGENEVSINAEPCTDDQDFSSPHELSSKGKAPEQSFVEEMYGLEEQPTAQASSSDDSLGNDHPEHLSSASGQASSMVLAAARAAAVKAVRALRGSPLRTMTMATEVDVEAIETVKQPSFEVEATTNDLLEPPKPLLQGPVSRLDSIELSRTIQGVRIACTLTELGGTPRYTVIEKPWKALLALADSPNLTERIELPLVCVQTNLDNENSDYANFSAEQIWRGEYTTETDKLDDWGNVSKRFRYPGDTLVFRRDGKELLPQHVEAFVVWVPTVFAGQIWGSRRRLMSEGVKEMGKRAFDGKTTRKSFEAFWEYYKGLNDGWMGLKGPRPIQWTKARDVVAPQVEASNSRDNAPFSSTTPSMASFPSKVAFAGLGAMGYGMASHLIKSGFPVTGFDVYQPTLDRFTEENSNASAAKTPREAVQNVDFLIVMVATSVQATPLLFDETTGAVKGLKEGATVVMCSTVAPAYIAEVQSLLQECGRQDIRLIDSPVSGGAERAAAGTLSIFASASDPRHLSDARDILQCLSDEKKLYEIPAGLGGGSTAKLIHQIFAGVHIAMSSEAMGLAALAGWDTKEAFEKLSAGEGSSWMFENRVPPMFDPDHRKYSAVTIITKDVGIITSTAREHKYPLPLLSTAEQLYLTAISAGWGAEDDCVLVRLYLASQPDLVATRAGQSSSATPTVSLETIEVIMIAVHLVAMSEAMSFCAYLGIDVGLMYDIVSNAAGSSAVFIKYFQKMEEDGWKLQGMPEVGERLVSLIPFLFAPLLGVTPFDRNMGRGWSGLIRLLAQKVAMDEVYALRYPLYLGSAALQVFMRAMAERGS
ncbi:MAG: hypothetical protein Q9184_005213 [Pyrenodesmia sp. 2 TL-2023]